VSPRRLQANGVRRPKSGESKTAAYDAYYKWNTAYNRRSVVETSMYRVKQQFGGYLTLRDYDAEVVEAMAMLHVLNKMTGGGIPESVRIV